MPISRNDVLVKCPFYKYDQNLSKKGGYRIVCEGIVQGSSLIQKFTYKRDFQIQIDTFCCEHYDRCEVYRMLNQKYEENNI